MKRKKIEKKLKKLIYARYTIKALESILSDISKATVELYYNELDETEGDLLYSACLGEIKGDWLDYDFFLIPTLQGEGDEVIYLVTGIEPSY